MKSILDVFSPIKKIQIHKRKSELNISLYPEMILDDFYIVGKGETSEEMAVDAALKLIKHLEESKDNIDKIINELKKKIDNQA